MKARRRIRSINRGFRSMTLDPSDQMRRLQRDIANRNTVAEAWIQTGQALQAAKEQVKANSSR